MLTVSLGSRLAIIIVFFSLTAIVAVALTAHRALSRDFEATLIEQQAYETERISDQVDRSLQVRLALLEALSVTLTDGDRLLSRPEINTFMARQSGLRELFSNGLLVLDEDATAIAEDTFVPDRVGTNYADRPHFARALETREPVISRPIIGRTTGLPLLAFVVPIESDEGNLLGFLTGSIDLARTSLVSAEARASSSRHKAQFLVIDTSNLLYVDSGEEDDGIRPLPDPGASPLIDTAMSGMSLGEITLKNGAELIYATSHLERLGWLFIRAVPKALAKAPATESFRQFLLISLGLMLFTIPLSYLVTRSAMAPLQRMTRRIRDMSAADPGSDRLEAKGPPEVRNLATAFNKLLDERDDIAKMQDDFISNVSHELRTPLTSLNGALRLMTSGTTGRLPQKAAEMSQLALRNGQRLQLLIADLLDFNKLKAGELELNLETQPLAPLITQAIAGNETIARERGIGFTEHCEPGILLTTDSHRLRQILDNLISNAIKFSPQQGVVVIAAESTATDKVRITVSDQGNGLPEHFIPRLFERFAQAEVGTSRASKGTGLGLAICRELTLLLGGKIGAYNDDGAHFWVELPLAGTRDYENNEST
ncbi:sensor histidine kinase [Marinobacter sp.]|uniref:sensor histidine kinase n=1 Tax=Marinobacter sp. TaxID=50741 RepID=UPI002B4739BB|nr:ATP-binding protein [Marinobacter sp.]HKK56466.1 ATP-binding protein [Marinobacter sp.]